MKNKVSVILGAAMLLATAVSGAATADEQPIAPATPPGPSLANVLQSSGITASGYVAASYYHSNGYNTFHQFDV